MNDMKCRIVKTDTINYCGVTESTYTIEKKFLWWWFNAVFLFGYTMGRVGGGSYGWMIEEGYAGFRSQEEAELSLEKYLINPYKEIYKNNKLILVISEFDYKPLYINKSRVVEMCGSQACYDASRSLSELKLRIDKLKTKTNVTIITPPTHENRFRRNHKQSDRKSKHI